MPTMRFSSLLSLLSFFCVSIICTSLLAADDAKPAGEAKPATEPVSYYRDIRPLFQEHCHGCHQPAKKSGGYGMTSFADMLKAGESEVPGIVPGKPDESNLIDQITPADGKAEMPKEKPPLHETQIALITRWIAEGAKDDTPASANPVYDADHPPVYKMPPVITSLDFSPDGKLLAISGYHEVLLRSADGAELIGRLIGQSERIEKAVFSPDSSKLAVVGGSPGRLGEVQIWDVGEKKLLLSKAVTYDTLYGASWTPDGTRVAFGCADNTVRVIDATTGEQVLYQGAHNDWVLDTTFSNDATYLISVSRDMTMKLIEVGTQRFIDNITSITPGALKGGLCAVDRRPGKDELLVGGSDGTPKLFRMLRTSSRKIGDDANLIRNYPAVEGRILAAAFSPIGDRIVIGSSNDGSGNVRVYQTDNAKQISNLTEKTGPIYAATFSPDGKTIAAGGFEARVLLIDADSGKVTKQFVPVPLQQ
jgi:mono/diheme cytochrome c family protein/roadblock/LC7 domain-containing protein